MRPAPLKIGCSERVRCDSSGSRTAVGARGVGVDTLVALLLSVGLAWWLPAAALAQGSFDHSYRSYEALLQAHVDVEGRGDYRALQQDGRLPRFIAALAAVTAEELVSWSRAQQVAFLVNAYNAFTLQTIVEAPGLSSIRDLKPDPWEAARWQLSGRAVSLNFIEHTRLRRQFREERVHFVLVCAAIGCPRLARRPLKAAGLDEQLDEAARSFVQDVKRNRVDRGNARLYLSRLFHWYSQDFDRPDEELPTAVAARAGEHAALLRYIFPLLSLSDQRFLEDVKFEVVFSEYDWGLNGR